MKTILWAGLATGLLITGSIGIAHASSISVIDNPIFSGGQQQTSGYNTEQGSFRAYDTTGNLAYNKTVSVSGTISGHPAIHSGSFINDGYFGNGRSWIGNSANSWLTIDLGSKFNLNEISFGRDRLGFFNDRDPGQFTIAVSSDLNQGYQTIVNSSMVSFNGMIAGNDTILTNFTPIETRYIKMTFAANGTAIDEVIVHGTPTPEPATMLLLGSGLAGLIGARRKRLGADDAFRNRNKL